MLDSRLNSAEEVLSASRRFVAWLDRAGYASFDPYDIWGTRYGLWSRRQYYRHGKRGAAFIAPILLLDLAWPGGRRLFVKKERFATADAQLGLAFLNLHAVTREPQYLRRAVELAEQILGYAIPGYRGPCWGYPFDWQNGKGAPWLRNTPYITCTPYCYEMFVQLHEATDDERYLEISRGIAEFVHKDLNETPTSATGAAGSYSPHDSSMVVNASAYRAFVLIDAGERFARGEYAASGLRNLAFVLESQRPDGSWLYTMDKPKSFIDNFHTCFNLKNLVKLNRLLKRSDVRDSVVRGFDYYRQHLFHADGDPKSFAIEPRLQLARLEMYNFAEGITLGALLGESVPEALSLANRLANRLITHYQLADGHFVTRVFRGGWRHTFPFLRWPQAQLFYALTNLARAMTAKDSLSSDTGMSSASVV